MPINYLKIDLSKNPIKLDYASDGRPETKMVADASTLFEEGLPGYQLRGGEHDCDEDKPAFIKKNKGINASNQDPSFNALSKTEKEKIVRVHTGGGTHSALLSTTTSPPVAMYFANENYVPMTERYCWFIKPTNPDLILDPRKDLGLADYNGEEREFFAVNQIPEDDLVAFCKFRADKTIVEIYVSDALSAEEQQKIVATMLCGQPNVQLAQAKGYDPVVYLNNASQQVKMNFDQATMRPVRPGTTQNIRGGLRTQTAPAVEQQNKIIQSQTQVKQDTISLSPIVEKPAVELTQKNNQQQNPIYQALNALKTEINDPKHQWDQKGEGFLGLWKKTPYGIDKMREKLRDLDRKKDNPKELENVLAYVTNNILKDRQNQVDNRDPQVLALYKKAYATLTQLMPEMNVEEENRERPSRRMV